MEKNGKQIFINVITHQSPFLCLFVLSEHERWRVGVSLSKANNLKKKKRGHARQQRNSRHTHKYKHRPYKEVADEDEIKRHWGS